MRWSNYLLRFDAVTTVARLLPARLNKFEHFTADHSQGSYRRHQQIR